MEQLPNYLVRFLNAFVNYEKTSDGLLAKCPCEGHGRGRGDRSPSVRIVLGDAGKIMMTCRSGCSNENILNALGLGWGSLFPDREDEILLSSFIPKTKRLTNTQVDLRDRAYRWLLSQLELEAGHREDLIDRGIDDEPQEKRNYRSIRPGKLKDLLAVAPEEFFPVPGFQQASELSLFSGLVVPVSNRDDKTVALKIRRYAGLPKYVYLSDDKHSPGNPWHYSRSMVDLEPDVDRELIITEGELKADSIAFLLNAYTVGVPGVNSWKGLPEEIKELGFRKVIVAYDWIDVQEKSGVRDQAKALRDALEEQGLEVGVVTWEGNFKGYDDLLNAYLRPFDAPFTTHWGDSGKKILEDIGPIAVEAIRIDEPEITPWRPKTEAVPFPLEAFPEATQQFMIQVSESLNGCPVDFAGMAVLGQASAAMGASRRLHVKSRWYELPTFYGAVVAAPGSAKSPTFRTVFAPMRELQRQAKKEYDRAISACGSDEKAKKKVKFKRYFTSNFTVESLVGLLEDQPRGIFIDSDEVLSWINGMDQYHAGKGNDRQFFLSIWNGEDWTVDRKTGDRPVAIITHPALTILGGIQPDRLPELGLDKDDGFLDRLLVSYPEEKHFPYWSDRELDEASYIPWRQAIMRLYNLPVGPIDIKLSRAGLEAYKHWYDSTAKETKVPLFPTRLTGFRRKLIAYCLRFALVLEHLAWSSSDGESEPVEVGERAIESAAMLSRYFAAHHERLLYSGKDSKEQSGLKAFMSWVWGKERVPGTASAIELVRAHDPSLPKELHDAKRVIALAVAYGLGEEKDGIFVAMPSTREAVFGGKLW